MDEVEKDGSPKTTSAGRTKGSQARGRATRARILKAATEEFAAVGFDHATTRPT